MKGRLWAPSYRIQVEAWMENDVFPWIGSRQAADLEAPDFLSIARRMERSGAIESGHRVIQNCGQIMRYAIASGLAKRNPVAVALALSFWAGWSWRGDRAEGAEFKQQAGVSTAVADQINQARTTEHTQADTMATIGAKHEEDRAAAPAVADAVVADLRSGALRLRNYLAACHTDLLSKTAAGALERDAPTQRREEFAGRVVRIGRDADDQLRACQAAVIEYQSAGGNGP